MDCICLVIFDSGFPGGLVVKNLPDGAGDMGSIPGSRRSPGGGNGNPTPVFLPGKSCNSEAWQAIIHGVAKRET